MWTSGKKPGKHGPATHWQTADWGLQSRVFYPALPEEPQETWCGRRENSNKRKVWKLFHEATGCLVFHFSIVVCTISSGQTQNQVETKELCPCKRTLSQVLRALADYSWRKGCLVPVESCLFCGDEMTRFLLKAEVGNRCKTTLQKGF